MNQTNVSKGVTNMEHRISVIFLQRKGNHAKDQPVTVQMRITINAQRIEQSTGRSIEPAKWSAGARSSKNINPAVKALNSYLDILKARVFAAEREMVLDGIVVTYESFKNKWLGNIQQHMVLETFKKHNTEIDMLIGKDFSASTARRYKTALLHTQNFIRWKYKKEDLNVKELNYEFIDQYAFWLKSIRKCNHNSTMKYLSNFKKIVNLCLKNDWLQKDPFIRFKMVKREVERPFLTNEEIEKVAEKKFNIERLDLVKDIFLFCCYTGLAYADIEKLKQSDIKIGIDNEQWIFINRQKTNTPSRIPILPVALELINKYKQHPKCKIMGTVFPVLSNQKMNSYLKEIADNCGISKNLTFHIARHTFATTVTLTNGVPIETVSKMLGHKDLRTTQHYAKILDLKVSEDMGKLRKKLSRRK